MPPIQDATPTSLFNHIDLPLLREWDSRPGGKVLAIPFDPEVRAVESHDGYRSKIFTAVTDIITTQEASVAAPRQSKTAISKNKTPTSFLIYNITPDQAETLLERKVWSSKTVTFRVAPFQVSCPSFLFSIKDLAMLDPKDVHPIVKSAWGSEKAKRFIESLIDETPADERSKAISDIETMFSSLYIERLDIKEIGNNFCPRFNVYANCDDFSNDKLWERLRTFFLDLLYISPMEAVPATTERIPFICTCCHGVDHPRGLCPFPDLPGWNGPPRDLMDQRRRNGRRASGPPSERQRMRFQNRA